MVDAMDRDGVKTVLPKGAIGYDDYAPGGDVGRIYIGTGTANIPLAKKDDEATLGTPIASAATTTIGTAGLGDYIHITGTTTITSFGAAASAGIRRTLIFDGALTLTHNATSLICVGGVSIVTVAGMVIEVVAETTANWRVVSITHPSISATELGYLDGVTGAIQTQLNAKAADSNTVHKTGDETIEGVKTFSNSPIVPNATTATQVMAYGQGVNLTAAQTVAGVKTFSNGANIVGGAIRATSGVFADFNTTNGFTFASDWDTGMVNPSDGVLVLGANGQSCLRIDSAGVLVISGAGIGYGTGSGGTVTQLTSKGTDVTLNKPSGQITMHNSSLAPGVGYTFAFNNNLISGTDTLIINKLAGGTLYAYSVRVDTVVGGIAYINVTNNSGVSLSESVQLGFSIVKGVNA